MYYVYAKNMDTGKEDFCGMYKTRQGAIERINELYTNDKRMSILGDYYYFIQQH